MERKKRDSSGECSDDCSESLLVFSTKQNSGKQKRGTKLANVQEKNTNQKSMFQTVKEGSEKEKKNGEKGQ